MLTPLNKEDGYEIQRQTGYKIKTACFRISLFNSLVWSRCGGIPHLVADRVCFPCACRAALDMPSMKPETGSSQSMFRIVGAYIFPTVLFITLTAQLPQYDPFPPDRPDPCRNCMCDGDNKKTIEAGGQIFETNKCFNYHRVFWEGNSDRGPNLGTKQIGLYYRDYIKEQVLDSRKI